MARKFKNITNRDLMLNIDGRQVTIGKLGIIEGDQYARFIGAGGLVEIIPQILVEPKVSESNLDKPVFVSNVVTEPVVEVSNLDKPTQVDNVITEGNPVTAVTPKRRGRPPKVQAS